MRRNQPSKVTLATEEPSSSGIASTAKAATALLRALSFAGNLTARRLFQEEMKDEIRAMEEKLLPLHPHLKGGALHNMATAELWENADQSVWEEKAKEIAVDIFRYACRDAGSTLADDTLVISPTFLI
jgi:hypothetical protein